MDEYNKRTFAEKLYKKSLLKDAHIKGLDQIDVIMEKIENPPLDGDEDKKN